MLTASQPVNLRIALLRPKCEPASASGPLPRLLRDMGHRVDIADSVTELSRLSADTPLDLLVVDSTISGLETGCLDALADAQWTRPPRQVAVLSDTDRVSLQDLRTRLRRSAVHLFLKPLHLHGLLKIVRKAEDAQGDPDRALSA